MVVGACCVDEHVEDAGGDVGDAEPVYVAAFDWAPAGRTATLSACELVTSLAVGFPSDVWRRQLQTATPPAAPTSVRLRFAKVEMTYRPQPRRQLGTPSRRVDVARDR